MGCGQSQPLDAHDQGADHDQVVSGQLEAAKKDADKKHKLLLLGPGNSGKSTFLKQLTQIHGEGFSRQDLENSVQSIYDSIIEQMKQLITASREEFEHVLPDDVDEAADFLKALQVGQRVALTEDVARHIEVVWSCEQIQTAFRDRTSLTVVDSAPHFFRNIHRIAQEDYVPTDEDMLLARIATTGIHEVTFTVQDNIFQVFDVGGQRNERQKWIHCFDCVHAVMFVVSLSCYDQTLYEDSEKNAMVEGLDLWDEVVNSHYFANKRTSMILFFNKSDLFKDKIMRKPISVCWPEFKGPEQDEKVALEFIHDQFLQLNYTNKERQIYAHVTCATDQDNVKAVFFDVQHGVVVNSLARHGIL